MKILGRYLLREHIGPFIFAITALTSMMLLQFIGKRLGDLVGKGLPWRVIAEFFVLSIPFTVAMTLPMAVLVAVLYAFSRLASENEITAMRANGVNMITLMIPVLIGGFGMGVVMLVFNDQVLSRANHELRVLQDDIYRTKPSFALKEQIINEVVAQKFYLRAAHIDRGTGSLKDVVIYDLGNPLRRRTIYADRGALALGDNGVDLVLKLYDGVMLEVPTDRPGQLSRLFYREDQMRVRNVTNSFKESNADSASKGEREMTVCEMQHALAGADLRTRQADYEWMDAQARILRAKGDTTTRFRVKPEFRNPPGLGRLYCDLLSRFQVKTAQAAEVGAQAAGQQPPRPPPPPPPAQAPARVPASAAPQAPPPMTAAAQIELSGMEQLARTHATMERYQRTRYDIEIQKKFSLAAACLIFVFLGPPIALRFPRGGVGLVIGVSFVVFALYYVGLIGGEELADRLYITPFWAMWGANMILLAIGLLMTSQMNRVSSTTRGGDWSELRDAGKAVLARLAHPFRRGAA